MSTSTNKRPNPAERRAAILAAAGDVFFDLGYAATSVDAIIERIGGSKRAIYDEFGNKEGLFVALVSEGADQALNALGEIGGRDLRATLLAFGRRLMSIYTSPALLGVYRAIVSEAQRFPDLARTFFEKGPGRAEARLTEVLESAVSRGEARIGDCAMAASHFIGMLRDNFHLRMLLGLAPAPDARRIEDAVTSAVEIFIGGIGVTQQRPRDPARRVKKRLTRS